jgi:hypothetical protein
MTEVQTPKTAKTSVRPEQRVSEHTPAAEQRIDEHEPDHINPRVRTRTRNSSISHEDPYYVDLSKVPPDVDVNWKRFSNVGEEYPFYIARMREQGWEPVNPQENPDWVPVPPGYDKTNIIKGGLILMERPMRLSDEAKAENKIAAKQQVREAEQRLGLTPADTMTRDHEGAKPRIVKEMMRPIAIED